MENRLKEVFLKFKKVFEEIGTRHPEEQNFIVNEFNIIYNEMMVEKEVSVV